ncbi:MAG: hypothetical protein WBA25_14585 [Jannaschia sp.]
MGLKVLESGATADAALPVAQLAAQMRLPEGYAAVPGQDERLRLRLRAAIGSLEMRLGRAMLPRDVTLSGTGEGSVEIALPLTQITSLIAVEEIADGTATPLEGAWIEADGGTALLILPEIVGRSTMLRVTVRVGPVSWDDVPAPLAQAALLSAETLDAGEDPATAATITSLVAPWRRIRIGGHG